MGQLVRSIQKHEPVPTAWRLSRSDPCLDGCLEVGAGSFGGHTSGTR